MNLPHYLWLLADAYDRAAQPGPALDALLQAQAVAEKNDSRCWEPEIHRLRGNILRKRGNRDAALHSFKRALDVATAQNAGALIKRAEWSIQELEWNG
jgi:tetratricopeptide (TPR) repeat protein